MNPDTSTSSGYVREGERVMIVPPKGIPIVVKVTAGSRRMRPCKGGSDMLRSQLIGAPYGVVFELRGGSYYIKDKPVFACMELGDDLAPEDEELLTGDLSVDNRNLFDLGRETNSRSQGEIEQLKKSSTDGLKLVQMIIESSTSYESKTIFSKQKYIKRKALKYIKEFRLMRPSCMSICQMYTQSCDRKIGGLRQDSLAMMLHSANIQAGSRVLVLDNVNGVLSGAVLERVGPTGVVIHVYLRQKPTAEAVSYFNIDGDEGDANDRIQPFDMEDIDEIFSIGGRIDDGIRLNNSANGRRFAWLRRMHRLLIKDGGPTAFVMASKTHLPLSLCRVLLPLCRPSSSFAVFAEYPAPLADMLHEMRSKEVATKVELWDTWYREYQILPNRTHPLMTMHGASGFVLSGVTLAGHYRNRGDEGWKLVGRAWGCGGAWHLLRCCYLRCLLPETVTKLQMLVREGGAEEGGGGGGGRVEEGEVEEGVGGDEGGGGGGGGEEEGGDSVIGRKRAREEDD